MKHSKSLRIMRGSYIPMANIEFEFLYNFACYVLVFFTSYIFINFIVKSFIIIKNSSRSRELPSPLPLPIIGHIYLLGSILPKSFQSLSHRYGPLMKIRMGASTYVVASNANVAKEIFKTHDLNFASRFELGPVQYSIYRGTGFMTAPYSSYYRFMKKLCLSKLFGGPQLERFRHIREQEIENLIKSVSSCCIRQEECNLSKELTTLTNNLMFRMLLSKRYHGFVEEVKEMREMTVEIMKLGAKCGVYEVLGPLKNYDLFGHGKKLTAAMRRFDDVLEGIMKVYEENMDQDSGGHDVMEILLETSRSNDSAQVDFTRNHIKHFISEILFASIDTLSAGLQWTMAELINNPTIFMKLREEINAIVGPTRLVKELDMSNLPYLQAIVKESLRLHSPTPLIFRECTKDCVVNGYDVKANTRLLINLYGIMRDPETWKDPDEFKPERFLTNSSSSSSWDEGDDGQSRFEQMEMKGMQDFSYIPFGGGRRACFGASLTSMVMHAAIGALTQCFDWNVKDEGKIDITIGSGFSGAMARPLVCYPISRFQHFL